jgi:TolB-like protein
MKLLKGIFLAVVLFPLMMNSGCKTAETTYHLAEDVDLSYIKKVAVLPLDNLTNDKFAADAVRQVVINELLITGLVDVTIPGDAVSAVEKAGVRQVSSMNAEQIKTIGKALKVQAVILGSVDKYGELRSGNFTAPEVGITLMMADTASGGILWSVSRDRVADSFWARHFGARSDTLGELTLRVVRECIKTLEKYSP